MHCIGKRALAVLLACSLLLGGQAFAAADGAPDIEIKSVLVQGNSTLEIGIDVHAPMFQSVGTVLRYDNTKLQLITWDDAPQTISPPEAEGWGSATAVVAAKGSDQIAAKPALAYTAKDSSYLYIAAEAFSPIAASGRAATVRFRCIDEADYAALDEKTVGREGSWLSFAAPAQAVNVLSATLQCTTLQADAQTLYADGYFKESGGSVTTDESYANAITTVWGAPAAGSSIIHGESVDACGVTFLDWDGTVLDTGVLPRDNAQIPAKLAAMQQDRTSALGKALADGAKPGYRFDAWLDYAALDTVDDPPFPSNNQPLAALYAEKPEAYAATVAQANDMTRHMRQSGGVWGIVLQAAYCAKTNEDGSFHESFHADSLFSAEKLDSNYNVYFDDESYMRYGYASADSGKYGMKVQFSRVRRDLGSQAIGVERAHTPEVVVFMQPVDREEGQAITSKIDVPNQETISVEISPTREMRFFRFYLAECEGAPTWINARSRTGGAIEIPMSEVIYKGTYNYMWEQAVHYLKDERSDWDSYVDEQALTDFNKGNTYLDWEKAKADFLQMVATYENLSLPEARAASPVVMQLTMRYMEAAPRKKKPSADDAVDLIGNKNGGMLAGTLRSYDPKKHITYELYEKTPDGYSTTPVVLDNPADPFPVWTAEAEAAKGEAWRGNGKGTGAYEQDFEIRGLAAGTYRLVLHKPGSLDLTIDGIEVPAWALTEENRYADLAAAYAQKTGKTAFELAAGDVNGDNQLTMFDHARILESFGRMAAVGEKRDLNGDRRITQADLDLFQQTRSRVQAGSIPQAVDLAA